MTDGRTTPDRAATMAELRAAVPKCPSCGHHHYHPTEPCFQPCGDSGVSYFCACQQPQHATPGCAARVTPDTPLRCDRCSGEWTVAQAEARPYSCPNDCYMGPRWQTLDGVPYFPKATETDV